MSDNETRAPEGGPAPEDGQQIRLVVNGKERREPAPVTVRELLDRLGLPQEGVAVERNRRIVPKSEHAQAALEDGDELEIVTLVGGG